MSENAIIILAVANIPLYLLVGWVFFDSIGNFFSNLLSAGRGNSIRAQLAGEAAGNSFSGFSILAFLITCFCLVYGEYKLILWWWGIEE